MMRAYEDIVARFDLKSCRITGIDWGKLDYAASSAVEIAVEVTPSDVIFTPTSQ